MQGKCSAGVCFQRGGREPAPVFAAVFTFTFGSGGKATLQALVCIDSNFHPEK